MTWPVKRSKYDGMFPCNVSVTIDVADRICELAHILGIKQAVKTAPAFELSEFEISGLICRNYIFNRRRSRP